MSQTIFSRVQALFAESGYRPQNKSELSRSLRLAPRERPQLGAALKSLQKAGTIRVGKTGRYEIIRSGSKARADRTRGDANRDKKRAPAPAARERSASKQDGIPGVIHFPKSSHRSIAFFVAQDPEALQKLGLDLDGDSLKMHERRTRGALHGDKVLVSISRSGHPGRKKTKGKSKSSRPPKGRGRDRDSDHDDFDVRVIEIVERRHKRIVGTFRKRGRFATLEPDTPQLPEVFDLTEVLPNVNPGDKVVADFISWDSPSSNPKAAMIKVLGSPEDPFVDIIGVIYKYNLPLEFPREVIKEAEPIHDTVHPDEIDSHREDWRDRPVFTIDPADAKDFDDAICITELKGGGWELAVHIADVSHYVRPGTALDREARKRGNSTYLVDRVIPMLPENLSNGICSLKPDVDRMTHAAILNFDQNGKLKKSRFTQAIIRSQRRYSYEEAFERLEYTHKQIDALDDKAEAEMCRQLHRAWDLASILRKKRFENGSLELDFAETKIILNKKGIPVDVRKVEYDISHQLIEEFMLVANEAVAKFTKDNQAPSLYRIHEDPDPDKLDEYRQLALDYGYQVGDLTQTSEIQSLLKKIKGTREEEVLKVGLLKSLKRAAYSADPLGHYGLAKVNYTHFTSPIRRYADLVVHRVLRRLCAQKSNEQDHVDRKIKTPTQAKLQEIGQHISDTERNSAMAEQDTQRIKLFEYLVRLTKQDNRRRFDALVTDVRPIGVFVELSDFFCKGLVKKEDLPGGSYRYDASKKSLTGSNPKTVYHAGEKVKVFVVNVDVGQQMVDFGIAK